jgi:hypothetical protein
MRHDTMAHRTRAAYIGDSARRLTRTWWRCYDVCQVVADEGVDVAEQRDGSWQARFT